MTGPTPQDVGPDPLAAAEVDAEREAAAIARLLPDPAADAEGPPAIDVEGSRSSARGVAAGIEADDVSLTQSVVGGVAAGRVTVGQALVGGIAAEHVRIERGGASGIVAGRVRIEQGGAARIVANRVSIDRGGAGAVMGWRVRLGRGSVSGAVIAARVDGEVQALLDWRGVLAVAVPAAIVVLLLRRR